MLNGGRSMLTSPRPLEEKTTCSGAFATEERKTRLPIDAAAEHTLRQLASSDMSSLLIAMSKDPAMLLIRQQVDRKVTNENYAREILELFSLGIGNYTENDIEVARAFTGWRNQGLTFIDDRAQHDEGMKTVSGRPATGTGKTSLILSTTGSSG